MFQKFARGATNIQAFKTGSLQFEIGVCKQEWYYTLTQ